MSLKTLRESFGRELKFNKYLQTSATFRKAVADYLGLRIKGGGKMKRECQMWEYKDFDFSAFPQFSKDRYGQDRDNWYGLLGVKATLRCDVVFDDIANGWGESGENRDNLIVECQFGLSDKSHRDRLMRYFNASFDHPYAANLWLRRGEIEDVYRDLKAAVSCIVWVAEDFRDIDLEWVREYGHPVACFQAVPKGRSVKFNAVHIPILIDAPAVSEVEKFEKSAMWV